MTRGVLRRIEWPLICQNTLSSLGAMRKLTNEGHLKSKLHYFLIWCSGNTVQFSMCVRQSAVGEGGVSIVARAWLPDRSTHEHRNCILLPLHLEYPDEYFLTVPDFPINKNSITYFWDDVIYYSSLKMFNTYTYFQLLKKPGKNEWERRWRDHFGVKRTLKVKKLT